MSEQSRSVNLYLHVHQPWRIRNYSIFDTAENHNYFDEHDDSDRNNERILKKVAEKSYLPMNALLQKMLDSHPEFRFSLSITGVVLEQMEAWAPEVLKSFQRLVASGRVEIVAETYYHSLAFFYSREEFQRQVDMHRQKIQQLFGVTPRVFRNTELAYNDELAQWADKAGYKGILAEGWDPVLEWRSPNYVYKPPATENIGLLLKNYRLSDDLAFRFGNKSWEQYPLKAESYAEWVRSSMTGDSPLVNLFMDYETFGEHQWSDTGIFEFFEKFIEQWLSSPDHEFHTLSETLGMNQPVGEISMPHTVTWADTERDLSAWLGNSMQHESMRYLYSLEEDVMRSNDLSLIADWRRLTTSDHAYYLCTKWFHDGDVHAYFSPYESPYDAFLNYLNALRDVRYRVMEHHNSMRLNG